MAKRRKVGNLLALAVLSVVVVRPMHPYEMATTLRAWGKDEDMEIKWGSLYTVVGNLTKHGLLEPVESTRHGRRPERTVYRITEAGRAELVEWTGELICVPQREHPRFKAGLSVLSVLPPDEAIKLLQRRLALLDEDTLRRRETLERESASVPRLFLIEMEYDLAIQQAESDWVRSLLERFASGEFPGLSQWRAFHDTGQLPADLAQLAQREG